MKKNSVSNFLIFFVSGILSLATAEIILMLFFPTQPLTNEHILFCKPDSILGWVKIPGYEGTHTTVEYTVHEKINSQGIRGPEYDYAKKDNEFRVLILGDSYTEGYMVSFEDLFSERLKKFLNENTGYSSPPTPLLEERGVSSPTNIYCEVINGGTGGWATDQELIFFMNEGKKYMPDLTILMFCENDTWYNNQNHYWRGNKPVFKIAGDSLILAEIPADSNSETSSDSYHAMVAWLIDHSEVIRRIKRLKDQLIPEFPDEFRVFLRDPDKETSEAWKITECLIRKLDAEARTVKSRLLVFYIPEAQVIDNDLLEKMKNDYGLKENEFSIDLPAKKLEEICSRSGIEFIDPTDEFKNASSSLKEKNVLLYYPIDSHWNEHGNEVAGKIIARYVLEKYGIGKLRNAMEIN